MLDPFPPLTSLLNPLNSYFTSLSLPSLPFHIHQILGSALAYQIIQSYLSPLISRAVVPQIYSSLPTRTRINWDVHVVSFVQSILISGLALWVIFNDQERAQMAPAHNVFSRIWYGDSVGEHVKAVERVYGYTGADALVEAMAAGYFLWDLVVSVRYYKLFGPGILAHAIAALGVYGLGFRPFVNYYGPTFILYELSSPFLNIHWFCDKLNLTGSKLQWYNGILLLLSFLMARLVWGTYMSLCVILDIWRSLHVDLGHFLAMGKDLVGAANPFNLRMGGKCGGDTGCISAQAEVMRFMTSNSHVPGWLALVYFASNMTLNGLNWWWYGRMIDTVRKRFDGKETDEFRESEKKKSVEIVDVQQANARRRSIVEDAAGSLDADVRSGVEIDGTGELKQRRKGL